MEIRNMKREDFEEIAELQVLAWKNAYKDIVEDDYLEKLNVASWIEKRKNKLDEFIKNRIVVVEDGVILGNCKYEDYNDEKYSEYDGEIVAIYTRFDKKNIGVGTMLVEEVKKRFKKQSKKGIIIWCLKENYLARKFYEKMNGKLIGERKTNISGQEYDEVAYGIKI